MLVEFNMLCVYVYLCINMYINIIIKEEMRNLRVDGRGNMGIFGGGYCGNVINIMYL